MRYVILSVSLVIIITVAAIFFSRGTSPEAILPAPVHPSPSVKPTAAEHQPTALETNPSVTPRKLETPIVEPARELTAGALDEHPSSAMVAGVATEPITDTALDPSLAQALIATDEQSIAAVVARHKDADKATRAAIEIQARNNPALRARLVEETMPDLAAEAPADRISAIASLGRLRAFDEAENRKIRPLLDDEVAGVRAEAAAYAGQARDKAAYGRVAAMAETDEDSAAIAGALRCAGVIAGAKEAELYPTLIRRLMDESPTVRLAALSCVFRMDKALSDTGIRKTVEELARSDSYMVARQGIDTYPIREQADEGLRVYEEIKK